VEPLEIELELGETLVVGNHRLTLLDIDGELVAVQLDSPDDYYFDPDVLGYSGDQRFFANS
jgi:hypothetical protein